MTAKDLFTPTEWESLERAPVMVARAVIAADMSGSISLVTEYQAMQKMVRATHAAGSESEIIGEVAASLTARQNDGQTIEEILGESGAAGERDAEKIREQALEALHALAALLAHKAPAEEANEFKRWLLEIGQRVADASKEGNGDSRVTEKEAATLGALATVLEVESPM
ncbi:MAG TPA: hypothetical protein VHR15_00600 [Ktedonobacterales bacterium]|jgi:hypothetical protein|nr:hypothetical protein [Ktedonobacterales bacterium]